MNINGSFNCVIIDLYFLLASPYRMKHLKENRCCEFFQNFLLLCLNTYSILKTVSVPATKGIFLVYWRFIKLISEQRYSLFATISVNSPVTSGRVNFWSRVWSNTENNTSQSDRLAKKIVRSGCVCSYSKRRRRSEDKWHAQFTITLRPTNVQLHG
jgi:hypothetical protein